MPDKDGKGPRKGSYMEEMGKTGPGAGHGRGNCETKYKSRGESS